MTGVPAAELTEGALLHELGQLHVTRHDTFRYGADDALEEHTARTAELEQEYLRRYPEREVDPRRTRAGARQQ